MTKKPKKLTDRERAYRKAAKAIPSDRDVDSPSWDCLGRRGHWVDGYLAGLRAGRREGK